MQRNNMTSSGMSPIPLANARQSARSDGGHAEIAALGSAAPEHSVPTVVVVDAGGTITATTPDRISYLSYSQSLSGGITDLLIRMYPELGRVAKVSVVSTDISGLSSDSTTESRHQLSQTVDACLALSDVVGVVVTGGTNILEEDAYFLDLTIRSEKPVVVTGAMHQSGTFTEDGMTNLFSAIRLAASERTTSFGTVILMNDQIFAAREVTKTDGYRLDAFAAGSYGAIGVVNADRIRLIRAPARVTLHGTASWKTPFDLSRKTAAELVRVEIVSGYLDASAVPIQALAAAGIKGIVTAGHGPGSMSVAQGAAMAAAIADGVLFVSATRTGGEGRYDDGSPGIIGAADLTPQKARLLLQLCMSFSEEETQVRDWFKSIGDPQFGLRPKTWRR
ncbi:L-asparaginase [Rhodococcus sp. ACS1]|nr:L-asparaginase [Rhodococcus sp. ACS1]